MLAEDQIINLLDHLGIRRERNSVNGWLGVLCPFHFDRKFGNASVHLESSVFNCFSCGRSSNIAGIIMNELNTSYEGALQFIENNQRPSRQKKRLKKRSQKVLPQIDLELTDCNPNKFTYTSSRGFTYEFLESFHIKLCLASVHRYGKFVVKNLYKDYLIIPISDSKRKVHTFEARKLKSYEVLSDFFQINNRSDETLYKYFQNYSIRNELSYKKGKLYQRGKEITNEKLTYIFKPKVLYPKNNQINKTIFNFNKLSLKNDLYIVEGIAGIPKIWRTLSQNVTALFGAKVTVDQVELLKLFRKRKIIIPDLDQASFCLLEHLNSILENLWVLPVTEDDTHPHYSDIIARTKPIEASRYLLRTKH